MGKGPDPGLGMADSSVLCSVYQMDSPLLGSNKDAGESNTPGGELAAFVDEGAIRELIQLLVKLFPQHYKVY